MTPQARAIIKEIAELRGVDPHKITGHCRLPKVVRARIEVTKRLYYERGYSTPRIGQILNHDHTTIFFYLGRLKKKPSSWVRRPIAPRPYAGADPTEGKWTHRTTNSEEILP